MTKTDVDTARANRDRDYNRWLAAQAKYDMMMNGSRPEDKAEMAADLQRMKARLALLFAGTREEDKALARAKLLEAKAQLAENEASLREAVVNRPAPRSSRCWPSGRATWCRPIPAGRAHPPRRRPVGQGVRSRNGTRQGQARPEGGGD